MWTGYQFGQRMVRLHAGWTIVGQVRVDQRAAYVRSVHRRGARQRGLRGMVRSKVGRRDQRADRRRGRVGSGGRQSNPG